MFVHMRLSVSIWSTCMSVVRILLLLDTVLARGSSMDWRGSSEDNEILCNISDTTHLSWTWYFVGLNAPSDADKMISTTQPHS